MDQTVTHQIKQTRLIPLKEVVARTSLSRAHLYRMMNAGAFPRPVKITDKRLAFVESEVDSWIDERVAARRTGGTGSLT